MRAEELLSLREKRVKMIICISRFLSKAFAGFIT